MTSPDPNAREAAFAALVAVYWRPARVSRTDPANTVDVPSCEDFVRRVEKAGGKVSVPKMAIPGVGWLAYCLDPEGNTFGIMQADTAAA